MDNCSPLLIQCNFYGKPINSIEQILGRAITTSLEPMDGVVLVMRGICRKEKKATVTIMVVCIAVSLSCERLRFYICYLRI